jgi:hypothetical protein
VSAMLGLNGLRPTTLLADLTTAAVALAAFGMICAALAVIAR